MNKKIELNIKYFEKLLMVNNNDFGILYITLNFQLKILIIIFLRTLEIMNNSLDNIQGDPVKNYLKF